MATVSLSVVGPNVGTYVYDKEINDVDAGRIITAYASYYGQITEVVDGETVSRNMTPTEIVNKIAENFLQGVLANVLRKEQEVAAQNAKAAVALINTYPVA